mgnify:CR=1 FL=1
MTGEAENGGHHVPTGGRFQRWSDLLLITDPASRRGGSGAEACYKQKSTRLQLTAVDRWGDTIGSRDTPLLVIPGSQTASYSSPCADGRPSAADLPQRPGRRRHVLL